MRIREAIAADARDIAEVNVASWRTAYRGIVPDAFLAGLSVEAGERGWAQRLDDPESRSFAYVAEMGGAEVGGAEVDGATAAGVGRIGGRTDGERDEDIRIVGFASGGRRREGDPAYAGELYTIYLLPEAQGHGTGRRLARTVAERLAREGMRSMLVWVLEANAPARGFYEALGGVLLPERHSFERAGIPLAEVSYGWADTGALISGR